MTSDPALVAAVGRAAEIWPWVSFGDLFDVQQGKALSSRNRGGPDQRPFLRTKHILWGELVLTDLDEMNFSPGEEAKYKLLAGDLLVCEGGEVGRCAVLDVDLEGVFYQNHIHRCRALDPSETDPHFYASWLRFAFLQAGYYAGAANRTTIANLSKARLCAFSVPKPDFGEQQQISELLRSVAGVRTAVRSRLDALDALSESLHGNLLTGAISVVGR